jgi:cell division septum initiation protein DivIVA
VGQLCCTNQLQNQVVWNRVINYSLRERQTMPQKLSDDVISAAIEGFQAQKRRLDEQIEELRALLPGGGSSSSEQSMNGTGTRKRRRMSAAARKRIAEAQRKRWAAIREKSGESEAPARRPKRKLSAAGRKRIIEANRKRWAAMKAGRTGTAGA